MTEQKTDVDEVLEKFKSTETPSSVTIYSKDGKVIRTLDEEELKSISKEVLEYLLNDVRKYKDFGMAATTLKNIIELKKAWFPATQVNKNLNVNLFDDQLSKWYQARKELKQLEGKEAIIVTTEQSGGLIQIENGQ